MRDVVHTVSDVWDGVPLKGIADFEGKPHHYEIEFDHDADDYSDFYRLTPISQSTFDLAMENWQIWLRWRAAFDAGLTPIDTHPALPSERTRYDELERKVNSEILRSDHETFRARGKFFVSEECVDWTKLQD